jgi:hypothetical protein
MTRWAIDLNSGARSFTRLRGEHSPADGRSLSSASDRGGIIEANDYAVDDSPNVLNKIVRARRQSRALSRDKIAPYVETIRTYQFACEVPLLARWRLESELCC